MLNGLDCTKETLYTNALTQQLTQGGISVLYLDPPGTGEALRLHGMPAVRSTEVWAGKVVDYLETRDDIDPRRIGLDGLVDPLSGQKSSGFVRMFNLFVQVFNTPHGCPCTPCAQGCGQP